MFKQFTSIILMVALCSSLAINTKAQTPSPLLVTASISTVAGNPAEISWEYKIENTTNADITLDFDSSINPDLNIQSTFCDLSNCVNGNNINNSSVILAGETIYYNIYTTTNKSNEYCDNTSFNYVFAGQDYNTGFNNNCSNVQVYTTPIMDKSGINDGKGNIIWSYTLTNYAQDVYSGNISDTFSGDQTITDSFCMLENGDNCTLLNTINGQNLITRVEDLKFGESVGVFVKVKSGANNQEYCNTATFELTGQNNNLTGSSQQVCIVSLFEDKIEISKSGFYNFDTKQIEWNIDLKNFGSDKVINITDILPIGTTIASVGCQSRYNPGACNQNVFFGSSEVRGELTMKYDDNYSFDIKANVTKEGEYCNIATYTGDASGQTENNVANSPADGQTNNACVIVDNSPVIANKNSFYDADTNTITWSINVENRGTDAVISIKDILPQGTTSIDGTKCFTSTMQDCDLNFTIVNNTLEGTMDIPNNGYGTIYFASQVTANGEYCNTAQITANKDIFDTNKECVLVENIVAPSSTQSSAISSDTSSIVSSIVSSDISSAQSSVISSDITSSVVSSVQSSADSSQTSSEATGSTISSAVVSSDISSVVSSATEFIKSAVSSDVVSSTEVISSNAISSDAVSSLSEVVSSAIAKSEISIVTSSEAKSEPKSEISSSAKEISSSVVVSSKTTSSANSTVSSVMTPVANIINDSNLKNFVTLNTVKKLTTIPKFSKGAGLNSATCDGQKIDLANNKVIKESELLAQSPNTFNQGLYQLEAKCSGDLTVSVVWENLKTLDGLCYKKFVNGKFVDFPVTKSLVSVGGKQMAMATYTITDNGPFDNDKTIGNIEDPAGPCDCDPTKTAAQKKELDTVRTGGNTNYWIIGSIVIVSLAGLGTVYFKKKKN